MSELFSSPDDEPLRGSKTFACSFFGDVPDFFRSASLNAEYLRYDAPLRRNNVSIGSCPLGGYNGINGPVAGNFGCLGGARMLPSVGSRPVYNSGQRNYDPGVPPFTFLMTGSPMHLEALWRVSGAGAYKLNVQHNRTVLSYPKHLIHCGESVDSRLVGASVNSVKNMLRAHKVVVFTLRRVYDCAVYRDVVNGHFIRLWPMCTGISVLSLTRGGVAPVPLELCSQLERNCPFAPAESGFRRVWRSNMETHTQARDSPGAPTLMPGIMLSQHGRVAGQSTLGAKTGPPPPI